jgi:nicotinate-nucleotide adenylyltransferase
MMGRIGVFGGTFDPVHVGHLILAEQCREQGRLDEVWFIPAARPPHKRHYPVTPFRYRVEMLELAVASNPAFRIDDLEDERPGPSYTVDTLAELARRHPDREWWLMIGSDSLAEMHEWHDPAGIVRQAGLLVRARENAPVLSMDEVRAALHLPDDVALRMEVVIAPLIEISSRDLRRRAAQGQSLRYLVPRAVECYIREKGLYREAALPHDLPASPCP